MHVPTLVAALAIAVVVLLIALTPLLFNLSGLLQKRLEGQ
jgi:hypothetical protein